ncbi:MAG TPA: division/cell wall cluster transcriptional repressor MraZ [Chitinophagales bacterium]|nr:division/cell wall cluster transcriptional repressor MraZ [Chitinophagales bacterium]
MSQPSRLIGEFEISVDAKGRIMMPAALKRQLPPEAHDKLVINRGFEKCLVLYPITEWNHQSDKVNALNMYVKENRDFARYFFRGATELTLDNVNRFLVPKSLLEYADVEKEAVLFAFNDRIELWSKKLYAQQMNEAPQDFSSLAEKVMGGTRNDVP